MNNPTDFWTSLLQGAPQYHDSPVLCSSDGELSHAPLVVCLLQHKSCLEIIGPDSKTFLQGQLTCDLNEINPQQWRYGAHCNHKGRMLSSFRASQVNDEHIRLFISDDIQANALAALAKYIVFSKADINANSELFGLGFCGAAAKEALAQCGLQPPAKGEQSLIDGQLLCIDDNRFEYWASKDSLNKLLATLKSKASLADSSYWKLLDIRAGIGEIQEGTEDQFIPQMMNFNELGAISFQKGCYTGQEIVARMQYRGSQKRHMVKLSGEKLSGEKAQLPAAGSDLYAQEKTQSMGQLVCCVQGPKHIEALAVIKDDAIDYLLSSNAEGPWNFTAQSLSYAITM